MQPAVAMFEVASIDYRSALIPREAAHRRKTLRKAKAAMSPTRRAAGAAPGRSKAALEPHEARSGALAEGQRSR